MQRIDVLKFIEPYDAQFFSDHSGHDLPGIGKVHRFDNCPTTMYAIGAAPFEVVKISRCGNFLNKFVAVIQIMRGFDLIPFRHEPSFSADCLQRLNMII